MRIYAIKKVDGGVGIMQILDDTTPEHSLNRMHPDVRKEFTNEVIEITRDKVPEDRTFRNAWVYNSQNNRIEHDITKAHQIKKMQFRAEREPKLKQLDVEFIKALEKGEPTNEIITKKEALRNITKIELPLNITELKNFKPDVLK